MSLWLDVSLQEGFGFDPSSKLEYVCVGFLLHNTSKNLFA